MADLDVETEARDTMWGRGRASKLKLWLLIKAKRGTVTILGLVGLFVGLVTIEVFGPSTLEKLLTSDELSTLFGSIVGAIITSVTLILTITQLVISQEIGSLGEQSDRIHEQKQFRERVEDTVKLEVSPSEPATFFRALVQATEREAAVLRDETEDAASDLQQVTAFTESIIDECELIDEDLAGEEFGTFTVIVAVLNFNYSRKINDARRLRQEYRDELSEAGEAALDELMDVLELYGPTRGFFKSLYFQWELINVSRGMVYAALPGLVVAAYLILAFDATAVTGTFFGVPHLFLLTSAAYAVTLIPFVLLLAYVLRILTVLKRTLAPGSFVLRGTNRDEDIDWQ
ncbi:hypothetical protein [Halorussus halophilus]|uniref:hypothetical protein n=1 Tax=Halorussus halophilus TaxID=2650975 RepID=UPI00130190CE|nr:hypothetical protein [Halorussus halophilus]